ncbi:MAG: ACT domain-containing protein [Calditrichia bacterium]
MKISLQLLEGKFAVHRFSANTQVPTEVHQTSFFSITRTNKELSIVIPQSISLGSDKQESDWRCLEVLGPLDFSLTGILAGISDVLAKAKISIFAISTFDTDYILVNSAKTQKAVNTLRSADYTVIAEVAE